MSTAKKAPNEEQKTPENPTEKTADVNLSASGNPNQDTSSKKGTETPEKAVDKKRIKKAFESLPTLKEVFKTADGFLFPNKWLARQHAKSLGNKKIEVVVKEN